MASTFSIDLASSQLPRQGLLWPCCSVQKLVRAASFRKSPVKTVDSPSKATERPRCHAVAPPPSRTYGGDAHGWTMVLVLNELLAVTAAAQHQRRQSDCGSRTRCLNCERKFSLVHDAASRPQRGFCSVDCRANFDYKKSIDADVDRLVMPSSVCSTIDSTYSPVEPFADYAVVMPSARP